VFIEVFQQNEGCLFKVGLVGRAKTTRFSEIVTQEENCVNKTYAKSSLVRVNQSYLYTVILQVDLTPLSDFVSGIPRKTLPYRSDNDAQCGETITV
jgi:hypothetical protein